MSSTTKTAEHIVPVYNLPKDTAAAVAEAAQSTEAAQAAQWPAEAAEAGEVEAPRQAAGGRMVCREIVADPLML